MQQFEKPYADGWQDEGDEPAVDSQPRSVPTPAALAAAAAPKPQDASDASPVAPAPAPAQVPSPASATPPSDEAPELAAKVQASPEPIFPCWKFPEHFPAILSRSALFSVERLSRSDPDSEPFFKGQIKAAGAQMSFSGPRLSMRDKELFCELASRAKLARLTLDVVLVVPRAELATSLGWISQSDAALDWLLASAIRLTRAHVRCKEEGAEFDGLMLLSAEATADGLAVAFDPGFVKGAFGQGRQFLIDRARCGRLKKSLSRWLHDFLSTHSTRQEIDLAYLREICGYPPLPADPAEARKSRKEFPGLLRAAVRELAAIAPELCAGVELSKGKKSSDSWKAKFTSGGHKPKFEQAEKHAPKAPAPRRANL